MTRAGARSESRILDVGSSEGELLVSLAAAGYRDLTGIDPFIERDFEYPGRVRVFRHSLEQHDGSYDVVMLHHSLEHVPDPVAAMGNVRRLLDPGGTALVRIPVAGNYGWRTYREHWGVGLNPPRHLVVPRVRGLHEIARRARMRVVATVYDGGGGYYALSEQARRGATFAGRRQMAIERAAEFYHSNELGTFRRWRRSATLQATAIRPRSTCGGRTRISRRAPRTGRGGERRRAPRSDA